MKLLPLSRHIVTVVLEGDQRAAMESALENEMAGLKFLGGRTLVYLSDLKTAQWLQEDERYTVLSVHRFDVPKTSKPKARKSRGKEKGIL